MLDTRYPDSPFVDLCLTGLACDSSFESLLSHMLQIYSFHRYVNTTSAARFLYDAGTVLRRNTSVSIP